MIEKLKSYLDRNKIKYVMTTHSTTFTAQDTAQSAHLSGKEIAKTVMVTSGGRLAMVVLPASYRVNLALLKGALGGEEDVEIASEDDFKNIFPDCEIGAMPPFGNLYHLPVFVDEKLREDEVIAFNAGNHRQLVKMYYKDFQRLVDPQIINVSLVPA